MFGAIPDLGALRASFAAQSMAVLHDSFMVRFLGKDPNPKSKPVTARRLLRGDSQRPLDNRGRRAPGRRRLLRRHLRLRQGRGQLDEGGGHAHAQGGHSIEKKNCLEFRLEKPPEFWLEIPYTKKKLKNW